MPTCERAEKCIFFNEMMDNMPVMTDIFKKKYCLKAPEKCARYVVAQKLGGGNVPTDLYPSHHDRAEEIVEGREPLPTAEMETE